MGIDSCCSLTRLCHVQVRRLGSERDTERGPASPPPAKKVSLFKRAYNVVTTGHAEGSTVSSVASSTRCVLF